MSASLPLPFIRQPNRTDWARRGLSPEGGYIRLAMNHEGHDMADWFNAQGITYAVLKYRMPNGHHDVPLSDAHQAIRLMREHANEWHIQKVGIMGASAGGHLASTAATHYTAGTHPAFSDPVLSRHKHGSVQLP